MPDELGDDLRIGLGCEHVPLALQISPKFVGIVERAIMDQRDLAGGVSVRVSVFVCLSAMRRPADAGG